MEPRGEARSRPGRGRSSPGGERSAVRAFTLRVDSEVARAWHGPRVRPSRRRIGARCWFRATRQWFPHRSASAAGSEHQQHRCRSAARRDGRFPAWLWAANGTLPSREARSWWASLSDRTRGSSRNRVAVGSDSPASRRRSDSPRRRLADPQPGDATRLARAARVTGLAWRTCYAKWPSRNAAGIAATRAGGALERPFGRFEAELHQLGRARRGFVRAGAKVVGVGSVGTDTRSSAARRF